MSETLQNVETQTSTAQTIVNTDTPLGWTDIAIVLAIVAAAVYYLYRKLWRKRGQCSGCASKDQAGCPINRLSDVNQSRHGG